jgi:sodium-dependent dicarboxylate transporter 2/3/5
MLEDLGPLSNDELKITLVFALTAIAWITRSYLDNFISGLTDAGIAIIAAIILFIIPSNNKGELLN